MSKLSAIQCPLSPERSAAARINSTDTNRETLLLGQLCWGTTRETRLSMPLAHMTTGGQWRSEAELSAAQVPQESAGQHRPSRVLGELESRIAACTPLTDRLTRRVPNAYLIAAPACSSSCQFHGSHERPTTVHRLARWRPRPIIVTWRRAGRAARRCKRFFGAGCRWIGGARTCLQPRRR